MDIDYSKIMLLVSVLNNEWNACMKKALKENGYDGIVPSHGPMLRHIVDEEGNLTVTKLAGYINRPKPTVTEMLNKLERLGHIERSYNDEDRRLVYIKATESGVEVDKLISKEVREFLDRVFCDYSSEQKGEIAEVLENVKSNINR